MYYTRKSKILHSINIGTKNNHLYFILVSAIALFAVMLLSFTPQAYAAEILCENTTLRGIITDDIRVPVDSRCLLKAFVQGDIFLEDNSLLDAYDSTIEGNIAGPETAILLPDREAQTQRGNTKTHRDTHRERHTHRDTDTHL